MRARLDENTPGMLISRRMALRLGNTAETRSFQTHWYEDDTSNSYYDWFHISDGLDYDIVVCQQRLYDIAQGRQQTVAPIGPEETNEDRREREQRMDEQRSQAGYQRQDQRDEYLQELRQARANRPQHPQCHPQNQHQQPRYQAQFAQPQQQYQYRYQPQQQPQQYQQYQQPQQQPPMHWDAHNQCWLRYVQHANGEWFKQLFGAAILTQARTGPVGKSLMNRQAGLMGVLEQVL